MRTLIVFFLGVYFGAFAVMCSSRPQWAVAEYHCKATGHTTGWYDTKARLIRCLDLIEVWP